MKEGKEK